jgi:hypothetical protein
MLLELPTLKTSFIAYFATALHSARQALSAATDHFTWLEVRGHGSIAAGKIN